MKKIILVLSLLVSLVGCRSNKVDVKSKTFYTYFDTVSTIYSYANDSEDMFNKNIKEIESTLNKYHKLFDTFDDHENVNGLYKLNDNAGKEAIKINDELMDFLLFSKEIYKVTSGTVNVMMGSVTSIWKKAINDKQLPKDSDLNDASNHTSIDLLVLDEKNNTAYISDMNARIDVGALAKGYVCQKINEELADKLDGYCIDLGGNILMIGNKASGDLYNVGIQDPKDTSKIVLKYQLANTSVVTSGNYERYFEIDGTKYHHIIDPSTNYPSQKWASVTIIYEDSSICDALSTALFSLDIDIGKEILNNFKDIKAIWIDNNGSITEYSN